MRPTHRFARLSGWSSAAALAALIAVPLPAVGQDAPGRAIFKCQSAGGPVYTDQPCAGPQSTVAVWSAPAAREPSSAMEPQRATLAPESRQPEIQEHRTFDAAAFARSPKAECPHLIQRLAFTESEERSASGDALRLVHERLSVQRKRYKELGCSGFANAFTERRPAPEIGPAAVQRAIARERLTVPGA